VLILVINKRYGGIAENDSTTEVSISRKEFRKAVSLGKPIFTFVHRSTWDERNAFKKTFANQVSQDPKVNKQSWFEKFRTAHTTPVQSHHVYDFVDEVVHQTKSNWIFQYSAVDEICETLLSQLYQFLGYTPSGEAGKLIDIPLSLMRFAGIGGKAARANLHCLNILAKLGDPDPGIVLRSLREHQRFLVEQLDDFTKDQARHFREFKFHRSHSSKIYAVDTSLELHYPDVWLKSPHFKRVLDASQALARNNNYDFDDVMRIVVFRDLGAFLSRSVSRSVMEHLIQVHRSLRIKLGIVSLSNIQHPIETDTRVMSLYLMSNEYLALQDPLTGWDLRLSAVENRDIIALYTDWCEYLHEICDEGVFGFWVGPAMAVDDVFSAMSCLPINQRMDGSC
jgi:hypothetical protein